MRLFELAHFDVEKDAGAAAPRQTDLVARYGSRIYLIEAKSAQRRAGVPEVDELRARMRRAAPGSIGILVSIGGFAESVPTEMERDRSHPILFVTGAELERVLRGHKQLRDLLRRKEDFLLVSGQAHIGAAERSPNEIQAEESRRREIKLVDLTGQQQPCVQATGSFDVWLPTLGLPDPDWAWFGQSRSVYTRTRVARQTTSTLHSVLEELRRSGWLQEGCSWAIRQAGLNWFGFDAASLDEALAGWEQRYKQLPGRPHHTEQVAITGKTDNGGLWVVEADIDGGRPRWVTHCEINLVLEGWPLDPQPLRRLFRAIGAEESQILRSLNGRVLTRDWQPRDDLRPLEVQGRIVLCETAGDGSTEEWVVGVVVRHPGLATTAEAIEESPWRAWTREHDVLPCALRSWHQHDNTEREYSLLWCEWSELGGSVPGVLMADWR